MGTEVHIQDTDGFTLDFYSDDADAYMKLAVVMDSLFPIDDYDDLTDEDTSDLDDDWYDCTVSGSGGDNGPPWDDDVKSDGGDYGFQVGDIVTVTGNAHTDSHVVYGRTGEVDSIRTVETGQHIWVDFPETDACTEVRWAVAPEMLTLIHRPTKH